MDNYNGRKPAPNDNTEKMILRPRNNIVNLVDILLDDLFTKSTIKNDKPNFDENVTISIPEISKNIYNKSRKSVRNNFKENIPIPYFKIHNYQNEIEKSNKLEIKEEEDISDKAYNSRHHKYELAEKRVKNRENEILQYHLYKMSELEEKIRHMEINNLIYSQTNEEIENNIKGDVNDIKKIDSNENMKDNKETLKKNKKQNKTEKINKIHSKKIKKENKGIQSKKLVSVKKETIGNSQKKPILIKKENEEIITKENKQKETKIKNENNDNDIKMIEIINVDETEFDKLLKNKYRLNAAIEKLLSCRINPYPDETHKLRRCTRKLKAFGVSLPHSLNQPLSFDDVIIKQKYLNLNHSKHRMSKRLRTTQQYKYTI